MDPLLKAKLVPATVFLSLGLVFVLFLATGNVAGMGGTVSSSSSCAFASLCLVVWACALCLNFDSQTGETKSVGPAEFMHAFAFMLK